MDTGPKKDKKKKKKKLGKKNREEAKDSGDEDAVDFRAGAADGEDSFDSDFDDAGIEDELGGSDDEIDLEAYLKWREQNADAEDNDRAGDDEGGEGGEEEQNDPEDDGAYDDEDDCA